jgi:hypothetical protein
MNTQTIGAESASNNMKLTAVEWLINQVNSKEWQEQYIWHKEEIFKAALHLEWAQMNKNKNKTENKDEKL